MLIGYKYKVVNHVVDLREHGMKYKDGTVFTVIHANQLRRKLVTPYQRKTYTKYERKVCKITSPKHFLGVALRRGSVWLICESNDVHP